MVNGHDGLSPVLPALPLPLEEVLLMEAEALVRANQQRLFSHLRSSILLYTPAFFVFVRPLVSRWKVWSYPLFLKELAAPPKSGEAKIDLYSLEFSVFSLPKTDR